MKRLQLFVTQTSIFPPLNKFTAYLPNYHIAVTQFSFKQAAINMSFLHVLILQAHLVVSLPGSLCTREYTSHRNPPRLPEHCAPSDTAWHSPPPARAADSTSVTY